MPLRKLTPAQIVFQKKTGLQLGRRIYSGDGEIYQIEGYPNRLVKIVDSYDNEARHRMKVLRYLKRSKNLAVVKIYQIGSFKAKLSASSNEIWSHYYYVMEKLKLLPASGREKKICAIGAALDNNEYHIKRLKKMGETKKSVRLPRKIRSFINRARIIKYTHCDIHEGNIMQDKRGTLKFVDLESFI